MAGGGRRRGGVTGQDRFERGGNSTAVQPERDPLSSSGSGYALRLRLLLDRCGFLLLGAVMYAFHM